MQRHTVELAWSLRPWSPLRLNAWLNKLPELRALLRLPEDREVHASLTLGYPKVKFKQTIRRPLYEVRYLD